MNSQTYQFSGACTHTDEYVVSGAFEFVWDINANPDRRAMLWIRTDDERLYLAADGYPFYEWDFNGNTPNGRHTRGRGGAVVERSGRLGNDANSTLGFAMTEVFIGEDEPFERVEFYIPNFKVGFDRFSRRESRNERDWSEFSLQYLETMYLIKLQSIFPLEELQNMGRRDENTLTVRLTVSSQAGNVTFVTATELADLILELSSIAYGDRVTWQRAAGIQFDRPEMEVFRTARHGGFNPPRSLLRVDYPEVLSTFLSATFSRYASMDDKDRHKFMALIDSMQIASQVSMYPFPFIILGAGIEDYCAWKMSRRSKKESFVTKIARKALFPSFRQWVTEEVKPLLSSEDDIEFLNADALKQKLSALLQRNLRARIDNLLQLYQIPSNDGVVRDFVKIRNSAVHGTYTFSLSDYPAWTKTAALMESIVFKELGYNGPRWDWSQVPPTYVLNSGESSEPVGVTC